MAAIVLWLDHNHAKLYKLGAGSVSPEKMHRHEIRHHDSSDPANQKNSEKFFHEVAQALKDAQEILLMGPGLAKKHFTAHLKRHHHNDLAKKVVATLTVDHPTDAEIVALARENFRTLDLFHSG